MRLLAAIVIVGALVLVGIRLTAYFRTEPPVNAEDDGRIISKIVDAKLVDTVDLRVKVIRGRVQAVATDRRGVLYSSLAMKAPFEADYFIDLSKLERRDFLWDARTRTLIVIVPKVRIGAINVDETRAAFTTSGLFVTRAAMTALRQRASDTAQRLAAAEAVKPAYLATVERDGRAAIANLFARPLRIAGVKATVRVRYEGEPERDPEQMDRSRSLAEIYGG
jgi:hypothetical protein